MSHTKEPWAIFEYDNRAIVTKEHPMLSLLSIDDDGLGVFFSDGDARRVVACVNACAGISTENLEDNLQVKELALRYNDALRQRDELLAALVECDEAMVYMSEYDIPLTLPQLVKDAIAKVKGGSA